MTDRWHLLGKGPQDGRRGARGTKSGSRQGRRGEWTTHSQWGVPWYLGAGPRGSPDVSTSVNHPFKEQEGLSLTKWAFALANTHAQGGASSPPQRWPRRGPPGRDCPGDLWPRQLSRPAVDTPHMDVLREGRAVDVPARAWPRQVSTAEIAPYLGLDRLA